MDGSIILNQEAYPKNSRSPLTRGGFFQRIRWAKKGRCHNFVKALGYNSTNIPELSRFHAWDPYFDPR